MESRTLSTAARPLSAAGGHPRLRPDEAARAPLAVTLTLTASVAVGVLLLWIGIAFALVHPERDIARFIQVGVPEQNQQLKTITYALCVCVLLPLMVMVLPRLADRAARGAGGPALPPTAALVAAGLGLAVLCTRLSAGLPWGDGLTTLASLVGVWLVCTAILLYHLAHTDKSSRLEALAPHLHLLVGIAAVIVVAAGLCPTKPASVHAGPLLLGALIVAVVVAGWWMRAAGVTMSPSIARVLRPAFTDRPVVVAIEVLLLCVLALALIPVVVIDPHAGLPNIYVPPGIVQYHQDFLLGPANQLLRGGGALLVNVPISQYGVGPIYLLYAFFHVIPIGYGSYGLLDGILTALFYVGSYVVLRVAGVNRLLAIGATGVAVAALVYGLRYPVGQLPQQGPMRFGLPMAIVLGVTCARRWPAHGRAGRALAFAALGLSAVWALEAFAYCVVTLAAMIAVEAIFTDSHVRRNWVKRQTLIAIGSCAVAHLVVLVWTLAATGHPPDWGHYVTYIKSFLLGGPASQYVYGFETWSPGLAVAAGTLAAAVVLPLVIVRRRQLTERRKPAFVALAGLTAFAVALLSYTDNRSSTYLLLYVTLPLLMVTTLWVNLLLGEAGVAARVRAGGLLVSCALAVVIVMAAWPLIGSRFSRSVLANLGPNLRGEIHRLIYAPPIDPRAADGERVLNQFVSGRRVLVLTPLYPDLTTEILIRSSRANLFFTGDPKADSYVPSLWMGKLRRAIASLRPGTRVLLDRSAMETLAALRLEPNQDVIKRPIRLGDPQQEWVLQQLQRRFQFRRVYSDALGFIVVSLVPRGG